MITLLVFNPNALPDYDGMTEHFEAWQANPFQGIEVVGTFETEQQAYRKMDKMRADNGVNLKFHIQ